LVQIANIEKRHYRFGFYVEQPTKLNSINTVQTKIKLEENAEPIRYLEVTDSLCFADFPKTNVTSTYPITASLQANSFAKKQTKSTRLSTIVDIRKVFIKSKNKEITDKKLRKKNRITDKSDWETFWLVLGMILAYSILLGLTYLTALLWLVLFSSILLLVAILLSILTLFILFVLLYILVHVISPSVC
jgi:hypothetical protein